MIAVRNTIFLLLFSLTSVTFGQVNAKPQIIGQFPLNTNENVAITIQFSNLIVVDLDDIYPNGFTLKLDNGKNYSFQNTTVTPDRNFDGTLTVPVRVNDGKEDSREFDLKIQVTEVDNVRPVITGQVALSTQVGESITLELSDLIVEDPDNEYPEDFTLEVSSGENYDRNGRTVTPDDDFIGTLTVRVRVDDGEDESERFDLKIEVTDRTNVAPIITGQDDLVTNEDQSITLKLEDLNVTDPDSNYPKDFTLQVPQGNGTNYTVSENKITPAPDFFGEISVEGVTVHDGKNESAPFTVKVTVAPVNDAPEITGQVALTTYINTPITIEFSNLTVLDPDNTYPEGFALRISKGNNYTVDGNTITPSPKFTGILRIDVTVNDGIANSNSFELQIRVMDAPNVPPVITGQTTTIIITENSPPTPPKAFLVLFSHLSVTDPDNPYPAGFTLSVLPGTNYSVSGSSITPAVRFTGTLSVRVSVNDGTAGSNIFNLQVLVVPITATPQIIGQKSLLMNEDESIAIQLTDLIVSDGDDTYPDGFSLLIFSDPNNLYEVDKNTVIPAKNLNGFLVVVVKVMDGDKNLSNPFNLAILINPVNDAPLIKRFEDTPLSYEPGTGPVSLTSLFEVEDVDNDYLSFAEITIDAENYSVGYDELLFTDSANIRGFFDINTGKLSLIGYATLEEYRLAVRSITYNYRLSEDEGGNGGEILPETKTLFLRVNDGQLMSEPRARNLLMETTVTLDIPTAFTPNGEEPNETWNVQALSNPDQTDDAVIRVYNKRGLLLFQSFGLEKKWDGTFNGAVLPMDTYYYTIDLRLSYTKRTYRGVVTILR